MFVYFYMEIKIELNWIYVQCIMGLTFPEGKGLTRFGNLSKNGSLPGLSINPSQRTRLFLYHNIDRGLL